MIMGYHPRCGVCNLARRCFTDGQPHRQYAMDPRDAVRTFVGRMGALTHEVDLRRHLHDCLGTWSQVGCNCRTMCIADDSSHGSPFINSR